MLSSESPYSCMIRGRSVQASGRNGPRQAVGAVAWSSPSACPSSCVIELCRFHAVPRSWTEPTLP
jgi:hypothetical protein